MVVSFIQNQKENNNYTFKEENIKGKIFYEFLKYYGNGDISEETMERWHLASNIKGVMIGRGLLARPWMVGCRQDAGAPEEVVRNMHAVVYRHAIENLCGDSQILSRLQAFWEYLDIPHKQKKAIMKAATLPRYREAVAAAISSVLHGE